MSAYKIDNIEKKDNFFFNFQYIYLIVLKSYATVNEEFWSFYLNLSIFLYAICVGYFYMEIPGRYAINYYICAGLNPDVDPYDYNKVFDHHILLEPYHVLMQLKMNFELV